MRVLVACPKCQLRYDASGRKVGTRFRCRCGEVVTIRQPRGHDADVVHCSACGAAREQGAKACSYCGADFTIHDTDLETICPGCLSRVSDKARFCHHCGTRLVADVVAGAASRLACPVCPGRRLASRRLSDPAVTILECRVCAGLWIGIETFYEVLDAEARRPSPAPVSQPSAAIEAHQKYRPCPQCAGLMIRRNFGRGESGVIIDVCGEHGLWFDCDELSNLLSWIRTGGLDAARRDIARLKRSPDLRRKRMTPAAERGREAAAAAHVKQLLADNRDSDKVIDLSDIARGLASLFDRLRR